MKTTKVAWYCSICNGVIADHDIRCRCGLTYQEAVLRATETYEAKKAAQRQKENLKALPMTLFWFAFWPVFIITGIIGLVSMPPLYVFLSGITLLLVSIALKR